MKRALAAAACALPIAALPVTALAETDFTDLSAAERAALGAEIRAVLRAHPELAAPEPPAASYGDEIAEDHALIAAHAKALFSAEADGFGPAGARLRIALFTDAHCPGCARARDTLKALARDHDLRVTLFDAQDDAALFEALGADALPFYVFPKMMLRGEMPAPVLERYLENGTGQF